MTLIKGKYRVLNENGSYDVVHLETDAEQVVTSADKQFVSDSEKQKWDSSLSELKIGTVQTGQPGDDAEVAVTNKDGVSTIDLTLPRGEQGPKGEDAPYHAFTVKEDGNLYVTYTDGTNPPSYSIKDDGNLYITI